MTITSAVCTFSLYKADGARHLNWNGAPAAEGDVWPEDAATELCKFLRN